MFKTIVALATPPLKSALAIIRLSGDDCFFVADKFFSKKVSTIDHNKIMHGYIMDGDEIVDDVVLLAYIGPHSYTGEDSVEIMCHGSVLIFNRIIQTAIKCGATLATHGEYTSRAYLHGKMDLIQAESVNDLINAESEESKKLSMMSLKGKTSELIKPIKEDFGALYSNIEVNIDYPEYQDIEQANVSKIIEICKKNKDYIGNLIKNGIKGKIIKDGINVAIVGKPNVGKSSILNALLNEDKAIVTDIKGTTRDIVEGKIILNGISINLFDTAGIRDSEDKIESIGIDKSKQELRKADLVIAVFSADSFDEEDKKIMNLISNKLNIIVYNKEDLVTKKEPNKLYLSAITKNVDVLKNKIIEKLELNQSNYDNPSINNVRELGLLQSILVKIKNILDTIENTPIDLVSCDVKSIYLDVLSITGEDCDFDVAKEIFSRFCVGK
ncbi:MAG: tRNA uridine-5-carboxymethylaminomethyl(34) synthesis GTPase MnmE [Erysipelotrichaceae bacterium]|nr:tRNA uridine-5-carboxymethylaminomethyl(34) synthesis GTPase MnmE [Erysipelotrichaceae bacterium]MCB9499879.1 tRNA uridine-5-carboxymethylaminomethyl(34) synthesis GTPase MnmE [Erysipelotrichaceae bacterium]